MYDAPMYFFLSVASIALFSFIGVASWSAARRKEREAFYRSELLKKLAEADAPGTAAMLQLLREEEANAAKRRTEGLKIGGLITVAVGVSLTIFIRAVDRTDLACLVGLIPGFVGLAMLAYAYLVASR